MFLPVRWQHGLVHFQEVVIFWKASHYHTSHVQLALKLLNDTAVSIEQKKGIFLSGKMDYEDHIILPGKREAAEYSEEK